MKLIKKNNLFCILLLLATTFNNRSMEPSLQNYVTYVDNVLLGYIQFNSKDFPASQLSVDIQSEIKNLLFLNSNANDLKSCAYTINHLEQINDDLDNLINNPDFCLKLIKYLSQRFNCSNQEAAGALLSKEAQKRLEIQSQFLRASNNEKQFTLLCETYEGYVDLDFTFYIVSRIKIEAATLLMIAAENNQCSLIQKLLNNGADINKTNSHGMTALMFAVDYENPNAVQCLLNHRNIAINQQDNEGNIALMRALSTKNKLIIKLLLKNGSDPEIANNKGLTPLELAQQNGDQEIINKITKAILKRRNIRTAKAA